MFAICPRALCREGSCAGGASATDAPLLAEDHEYLGGCPTTSSSRTKADEQDCSRDKKFYGASRRRTTSNHLGSALDRVLAGRCAEPDEDDDGGQQPARMLQDSMMMTFIRTLLRGICIEVLLDDGSCLFPETSLNYELTHLILDMNEAQRSIPLRDVEGIVSPKELEARNILTSIQPFLDERCCTLIIRDFEFVTFRFDTARLREYFSTCLLMLISRDGETAPEADGGTLAVPYGAGAVSPASSRREAPHEPPASPLKHAGSAAELPEVPRESSQALPALSQIPGRRQGEEESPQGL